MDIATLAGGCFWCIEPVFAELRGVHRVTSGYIGGMTENPGYRQVCSGTTGHAEAIQIDFDPTLISFRDLLDMFFAFHDPTTLNRQGADAGTQYRSAIFYQSEEQKTQAEEAIRVLNAADIFSRPVVTTLEPAGVFYPAEEYHQEYYRRNPEQRYCQMVIVPKMDKLRSKYLNKLKD